MFAVVIHRRYQAWVEVWLSTPLGAAEHSSRGMFVEALWWFLHRTSAFSVEVRADDLAVLHGALEALQPWLCPASCPDNTVRKSSVCHLPI
jgi:hypothetical protein